MPWWRREEIHVLAGNQTTVSGPWPAIALALLLLLLLLLLLYDGGGAGETNSILETYHEVQVTKFEVLVALYIKVTHYGEWRRKVW